MITRSAKSYLNKAYQSATNFSALKIIFYRLDNETSGPLEKFIKVNAISFQYVPPNNHRVNMVEIAVRDGKTHFATIICGVHPSFPVGEWDLLIPYAELTLNLLRPFGPDPSKSAHTGAYGSPFDFAAPFLAPAGCLCVGFTASDIIPSWAPHGYLSYYLGPSPDHCRCYSLYVISTKSSRVTNTVDFLAKPFVLPGLSPVKQLRALVTDMGNTKSEIAKSKVDPTHRTLVIDKLSLPNLVQQRYLVTELPLSISRPHLNQLSLQPPLQHQIVQLYSLPPLLLLLPLLTPHPLRFSLHQLCQSVTIHL